VRDCPGPGKLKSQKKACFAFDGKDLLPVNWSAFMGTWTGRWGPVSKTEENLMTRKLHLWREHYLCCLHIYCRLIELGFSQKMAMLLAKVLAWPKI